MTESRGLWPGGVSALGCSGFEQRGLDLVGMKWPSSGSAPRWVVIVLSFLRSTYALVCTV